MCFVENQCMSYTLLDTSAKHIFVQPVEHQKGKRPLQGFVLRRVNTDNSRQFSLPQAFLRLNIRIKKP